MTLFGLLKGASSSSQSISSAIRVVSDNIAGSNDEHYDKQTYNFRSISIVGGVSLGKIVRSTAPLLEQLELYRNSDSSKASTLNDLYQKISEIQGLTHSTTPTLVRLVESFINAWQEYHQNPASSQVQSELVRRGEILSIELGRISQNIADLAADTQISAEADIKRTNTLLENIQQLNERVAEIRGSGESSSAAESKRDSLLIELSAIIRIKVFNRGNGQIAVYAAGDREPQINPLTTGHNANRLIDRGFVAEFLLDQQGGLRLTGLPNLPTDALWLNDDQNFRLPSGSLLAKLNALRDNIDEQNPSVGIFKRMNDQLDAFADLWTKPALPGQVSFSSAYNALPLSSPPRVPLEVNTDFFISPAAGQITNRFDLRVNPDLLNNPSRLKRIDLHIMVDVFSNAKNTLQTLDATGTYVPTVGLDGNQHFWNQRTYLELTTDLSDHWGQVVNEQLEVSIIEKNALDNVSNLVKSITGVDINEELADMTVLQNAFAANARIIRTIKEMLDTLINII